MSDFPDRPWQDDVQTKEGTVLKPDGKGKYQAEKGPVAEIKVWVPVEDIAKFERYFRTIHPHSVCTIGDIRARIQDAAQFHANECQQWAERHEREAQEAQEQQASVPRYYQPSRTRQDHDRGDDR